MKLKLIKLTNFQSHTATKIELGPGITSLTGPTDVGKSAVIRALRWAALNDLPGEGFIAEGEKEARVAIKTDGHAIRRSKSRGQKNTYEMDGTEFKAFGQGVPTDIEQALNLSPVNFQSQHDAPFWFSETAGEVSRQLNAVIDLSVIDTALSNVGNAVRRGQERVTLCEERVLEMKLEQEKLEPQRERVEQFKRLEERHDKHDRRQKACDQLDGLLRSIRANPAKRLREKARDLEGAREAGRGVIILGRRIGNLEALLRDIVQEKDRAAAPPSLSGVTAARDKWRELDQRAEELNRQIQRTLRARMDVDESKAGLKEAEEKFHAETDGQACPLCGRR